MARRAFPWRAAAATAVAPLLALGLSIRPVSADGRIQTAAPSSPRSAPRRPAAPAAPAPAKPGAPKPATATPAAPPVPSFFVSPYDLSEMRGKQAVVDTTAGTFVIQLLPELAPNHVGLFMKLARDGAYTGTIFHSVVANGAIIGGDLQSRDPAKAALYGTSRLYRVRAEPNSAPQVAGTISAALLPGDRDSGGEQFFICVGDQPALTGQYDAFGRVVDGLEVVQQISTRETDADGHPKARVEIRSITIRDTPPEPFLDDTAANLASYRVVVETTMGTMTLEMLPEVAPETVRAFLRLVQARVYDGVRVHRVAHDYLIQTGALQYRDAPLTISQAGLVHDLAPEFSATPNVPGLVSMARGDDPGSAQTSFFICTNDCRQLDGQYTAFARVVDGLDVLKAIGSVPTDGELPTTSIVMTRLHVETKSR